MKSKLVLLCFSLCTCVFAKNYAFVVAGWSKDSGKPREHHEFALDALRQSQGLKNAGWETAVLYSGTQSRTQFHETAGLGTVAGPASKASFLGKLRALKAKLGAGDKVYLSINAHGLKRDGTYDFSLVDDEGWPQKVTAEELEAALAELKSTGAQVALTFGSCHSGDIPPATLAKLRDKACIITSSYEDTHSEACMESDFDARGELLHPENKSHTSMASFVASWLHARGNGSATNPFTPPGKCWKLVSDHYSACLAKAVAAGIRLTPQSSLKDVMRAGRFCDESVNMPDSTGKGRALGEVIPQLGRHSHDYLYGTQNNVLYPRQQINPFAVHDMLEHATQGQRAIAAARGGEDAYARELHRSVTRLLAVYRTNLARQERLLNDYKKLLEEKFDAAALRRAMGSSMDWLTGKAHDRFLLSYPSQLDPRNPRIPETKIEDERRDYQIALMQELALAPTTPAEHREKLSSLLRELNGGEAGAARLREITELKRAQNALYAEFLSKERVAYEATAARERDSCNDFTFE